MRHKGCVSVFLSAGCIFLAALNGWAAPIVNQASGPGVARGVACYIMGYHAELMGHEDVAADYYRKSIAADDSSPVVRLRLALAYAELGDFPRSVQTAEEAARRDPEDLSAHYFLAILHSQLKDKDKSSVEYEHVLKSLAEKNPGNGDYLKFLGQLHYADGKDEQAMTEFAAALKLDPEDASLLYMLGAYYLDGGRKAEGLDLIKKCLAVDAGNPECLNSLAYTYAEDNVQLDEALESVNAALDVDPENAAFLDTRGWIYYRQAKYAQALQDLKHAEKTLSDPVLFGHLSEVLQKSGDLAEAKKYQLKQEQALDDAKKKTR